MVRIKVCGITNEEDTRLLAGLGVDALGFIIIEREFPRKISVESAKSIISRLPSSVSSVVAVVREDIESIIEICRTINPDALEIHSDMEIDGLRLIKKRLPGIELIRTVFVRDNHAVEIARKINAYVDYIHLDNPLGAHGVLDWGICRAIAEECTKPVILAGGLNPDNVQKAILAVRPNAVDVMSGVEDKKSGRIDFGKVKEFLRAAKEISLPD